MRQDPPHDPSRRGIGDGHASRRATHLTSRVRRSEGARRRARGTLAVGRGNGSDSPGATSAADRLDLERHLATSLDVKSCHRRRLTTSRAAAETRQESRRQAVAHGRTRAPAPYCLGLRVDLPASPRMLYGTALEFDPLVLSALASPLSSRGGVLAHHVIARSPRSICVQPPPAPRRTPRQRQPLRSRSGPLCRSPMAWKRGSPRRRRGVDRGPSLLRHLLRRRR